MRTTTKFVLKVILLLQLLMGGIDYVNGQNNALIINGAYINVAHGTWASPIYLVVNNGTPAAISRISGHIISEQEGNFVEWNTADVTVATAFVFPFGFSNTNYLPVTVHKASIGAGIAHVNNASAIDISTWSSIPSNLAWATSVTAMTGAAGANATNSVVDRWWQVVDLAAVTGTLDVTYQGVENTTAYPAGPFAGQEWDVPTTTWLTPSGAGPGVVAGTATVTGITLVGEGLGISAPYILSAQAAPLPIELVSFTAACEGTKTHIKWSDASETNVSNIELQKSEDMNTWTTIYVAAPSNQSTTTNYNFSYPETYTAPMYYRLKTNNNDGGSDISASIYNQPCSGALNTLSAFYYDNTINVLSHFQEEGKVNYSLFDIQGKEVLSGEYYASKGEQLLTLPVDQLVNSIYILRAASATTTYNQKIIVAR